MSVLVINQHASNKGDRAVLTSVVRELARNEIPSTTVSVNDRGFSFAEYRRVNSEIQFVPWGWSIERSGHAPVHHLLHTARNRWFLHIAYPIVRRLVNRAKCTNLGLWMCHPRFRQAVRTADYVISTGGHHLTTLLAPDAVSPQVFDIALTLLAGKKTALWSQSVGPFEFAHPENQNLVRRILTDVATIIVRDEQSLVELQKLEINHPRIRQTYDSVVGLYDPLDSFRPPSQRESLLGISIYAAQHRSPASHTAYVRSLAQLVDHAVSKGYRPRFFPMELKGSDGDDRPLIFEIMRAAGNGDKCSVEDRDLGTLEHIAEVARCRVFVGHKTHSVIFSLISATPIIAIAYHKKTADFMQQYQLSEYCIDDRDLRGDRIISLFEEAFRRQDEIADQEWQRSRAFSQAVHREFREMLTFLSS